MTDLWDRVDKAGDQLMDDKARLQAQLEAVRRERDEAQLYLTQERANKDSLAACLDRDVKKIKDLQTALTQLQALVRGPVLTAARNYQVPCYCGDPNKPCENHDRSYVDRGVIAALDASLDPAPVEEQTETMLEQICQKGGDGEALFPIQRESGVKPHPTRIPWSVAELAYAGYSAENGRGQSLERLAERHGFYPSEMDKYLPDWRERCDEIKALRDERDRLRSALEDIRDSIGNGALNVDWIKKCAAAALTPAAGGTRHG